MSFEEYTKNILTAPDYYRTYAKDRYTSYCLHRGHMYGARAIRYDNPLGCKIQTSGGRTEADAVIDMIDEEYVIRYIRLQYYAAESYLKTILDCSGLSDKDKQIIQYRYLTYPTLSYDAIARRMGYSTESGARMAHNRAVNQLTAFIAASEYF